MSHIQSIRAILTLLCMLICLASTLLASDKPTPGQTEGYSFDAVLKNQGYTAIPMTQISLTGAHIVYASIENRKLTLLVDTGAAYNIAFSKNMSKMFCIKSDSNETAGMLESVAHIA